MDDVDHRKIQEGSEIVSAVCSEGLQEVKQHVQLQQHHRKMKKRGVVEHGE